MYGIKELLCFYVVDDVIQISVKDSDIDTEIRLPQNKRLKMENQGHHNDYDVVNIVVTNDG